MLFISSEYPPDIGGVADYTYHLTQAFAGRGHEAPVLTSADGGASAGEQHRDARSWRVSGATAMARAARALRPDVVNFQYVPQMYGRAGIAPGAALLPLALRRAGDAQVTCTMHEIASPFGMPPKRLAAALAHRMQARLMVSACDRIIVTNPAYARRLRGWTRAPHKVWEIPVGASILPASASADDRAALRASLGAGSAALIGESSPLAVGKRPDDLLRLAKSLGPRARLVMLGGLPADAGQKASFICRAEASGVADRIIWTGPLSATDLSRHLSALDVYVHTHGAGASSRSTTLVSALAHGLPIVAYDGAETGASLAGGGVALVSNGDTVAFASAVATLLDSPGDRARSGALARELHARNFAWDVIARRLEEAVS
jgi:glycosyltransferase involved in cell wall biosynthesis